MTKLLLILLLAFPASAAISTNSDVTGVSTGGGGSVAWTDGGSVTFSGGGTLTVTTDYNRYYVSGKALYWQFSVTQSAAGSGTTDVTFDIPGGVTALDSGGVGHASTFDMGNNNVYLSVGVEAQNSTNTLKVVRSGTGTYLRGGTFVGNNGVVNVSVSAIIPLE